MATYYTIYEKKTEKVVAFGTAKEYAKQMNRSVSSFYCTVSRNRLGKHHKYVIVSDVEEDDVEHDE